MAVVTDSSTGLPTELVAALGIKVVPLHVRVGARELREGVDDMPADLAHRSVTTSAASPGELQAAYEQAAHGADGVVAVHLSRYLSGTFDAARTAAAATAGPVRVVDSASAGMGTGFGALAAARVAHGGGTVEEVTAAAVRVAERARCLLVVDRLEQLRRGGRISTAATIFGTGLVSRPLLQLVDGRLVLKEKARTASKVLAKLSDTATRLAGTGGAAVAVQHLDAPERAAELGRALQERVPLLDEFVVTEFGPTLGVHLGSGALGAVVVPGGAGVVHMG
ncbi:DegV family protein [Skermania piniformis]